jgi:hypothetical protein
MPRWDNNLKDNCINILDNVIKNLKPDRRELILYEILSLGIINNKKKIEQYIRNKLGLTSKHARHTTQYWSLRGWSENESYVKSKENKQKNVKSVYSKEFWLEKINPYTNKPYTIEEADFERNCRRPIRKEYWVKKGYNEVEAMHLAEQTKSDNNKKGASQSANSTVRHVASKRCVDYYTARDYSEEDAKKLVSESQKHFSKEICIEKYGKEKGLKIWQERQDRWQARLSVKSDEEKARINRLKLSKGITVSKAEKEIINEIKKANKNLIVYPQYSLSVNNKKQYVYDIVVDKKIIEYNGDFWHCNPKMYTEDYINPRTKIKASDKWTSDIKKIEYAQTQGYVVMVVWESDFKENKEEVLKKCIQFLTQ